ncbi:MAG: glutathione transferase GstA [Proteobacteria bacterium]|nr:glutathione transferase GstA [Pseudomonadota bacterium]
MKLYYTPGACSLAPHIVALEAGLTLELEAVDLDTGKTSAGADFKSVNPKGYVPALVLDDGRVLTEGPAIMQYIADLVPGAALAPAAGTFERYQLQEWLAFINSEVHKAFSPLFNPTAPEALRAFLLGALQRRYTYLDERLQSRAFLMGHAFTVADVYLFVVTTWAGYVQLDLDGYRNVQAFQARVGARPAVRAAMAAEGLAG